MTYQRRGKSVSVVHWASFSLTAGLIMGFAPMDLKLREIIIFLGILFGGINSNVENPNLWKSDITRVLQFEKCKKPIVVETTGFFAL